jgi:hypothetical protein
MSVLKTLNFVAVTKRSNDPVIMRRAKLIMQLQQQRALADNPTHIAFRQKWERAENGVKQLVERQKRIKRWWYVDAVGQCYLTINYGSKKLELEKGKSAIAVGSKDNLVATLDAVIAAVEAGELDAAISATQKTGQKPKARAA